PLAGKGGRVAIVDGLRRFELECMKVCA
ncbi:MAG: hypothetical protein RL217_1592, partial [Pseudomonadota bacterium]